MTTSLKCFQCYITQHSDILPNVTQYQCENFDGSEKFVEICGSSSICRKTVITGDINGDIVGVERSCVNQPYNLMVKYNKNGSLFKIPETDGAFKDGCHDVDSYGMKSVSIKHCYCETDLCNSANLISIGSAIFLIWFLITIVI